MEQPAFTESEPGISNRLSDDSDDPDNDSFAAVLSQDETDTESEGNILENSEEDSSEDELLSDEGSFSDEIPSERADDTASGDKFNGITEEVMEEVASLRSYTITQDANATHATFTSPLTLFMIPTTLMHPRLRIPSATFLCLSTIPTHTLVMISTGKRSHVLQRGKHWMLSWTALRCRKDGLGLQILITESHWS